MKKKIILFPLSSIERLSHTHTTNLNILTMADLKS